MFSQRPMQSEQMFAIRATYQARISASEIVPSNEVNNELGWWEVGKAWIKVLWSLFGCPVLPYQHVVVFLSSLPTLLQYGIWDRREARDVANTACPAFAQHC